MSASSAAAPSSFSRPRAAIAFISAVTTICVGLWLYKNVSIEIQTGPRPGSALHRSNAVHRRRRRTTNTADDSPFAQDPIENDGAGHLVARALTDGETVVDDQAFQEEYGWTNLPESYQRNGQNIVQLLFRVSEDATRRNAYVHRGCACNSCGVVPIRGIRYRCANCADYDLCEGCESQGMHTKTHIFYKVRVPAPSFGPRCIQPVWYLGDPDTVMRTLPKPVLAKLSRETGFERPELDAYWEQWTFMANTDWRDDPDDINLAMDRKTFERCLVPSGGYRHAAPSLIFDRMFAFYDTNKDDLISFPEFLHGIGFRKKKEKWNKVFEGYDIDGDGYVDRKDFLRMFRSYYVLYRQMHRDMLEGMEEQQMTSTEAHRLVSSRQPLSSAFGQDGRYPRAPDPRTGEGKALGANGDQEIVDGKGVINESGNDTGNREDLFKSDVPRIIRSHWEGERPSDPAAYLAAVLNPPETIEQMPDVLRNLRRIRGQTADTLQDDAENFPNIDVYVYGRDSAGDSMPWPETWPPTFVTVTDEDAEAVEGPGTRVEDVRRSSQRLVIQHAQDREAQREIYQRWQRRQFYTDEEEGATPPVNWKDDDDVLAHNGVTGESSKSSSRPIRHSRSSSKVRFAEDMDDFDTRSNPSTSSRSVPERWGGIEIPDAERDAGKEILYQVTQQAFNELLDPLFKEKEDWAIGAAETKDEREKYRYLFTTPEFEKWVSKQETGDAEKTEEASTWRKSEHGWVNMPEVEVEQVRERPLEELLAAAGYQVEANQQGNAIPDLDPIPQEEDSQTIPPPSENPNTPGTPEPHSTHQIPPSVSPTEGSSMVAQYDVDDRELIPFGSSQGSAIDSPAKSEYHDPTLPRFRPNSVALEQMPHLAAILTSDDFASPDSHNSEDRYYRPGEIYPETEDQNDKHTAEWPLPPLGSGTAIDSNHMSSSEEEASLARIITPDPPIKPTSARSSKEKEKEKETEEEEEGPPKLPLNCTLYKFWKLDRAAKQAEERGGWGRLDYAEFEAAVKKMGKEGKGNQMDYLGSWIEFCIP